MTNRLSPPRKRDQIAGTPNLASQLLLKRLDEQGVETLFDRFERQSPQCGFGTTGQCCRMCQWGPCRITPKAERGVCGKDQPAMVMGNLLRSVVAGLSAHARHAHEVLLTVVAAAEGRAMPLRGGDRALELAPRLGIDVAGRDAAAVAADVARALLEDLSRMTAEPMRTLEAFAPEERKRTWAELGILPRSAAYEVMESLHMTTLGGCTDWTALARQDLRAGLAYCYATLFGTSLATEILFGMPERKETVVNYGVLRRDHVNVLLHGHSPVMLEVVLAKLRSPEIEAAARAAGAQGIAIGGLCCSGEELLARHGIPTVTNIGGQELVLGTGAVDALVVDMQCVIPGTKILADCFGTQLVTTSESNRIPGALHVPFDPERRSDFERDAERIAQAAIAAFTRRDRSAARIPPITTPAIAGWTYESIVAAFGGPDGIVARLRDGRLRGIATVVGCNTPKTIYEANHVRIARQLVADGVLVLTTGCSAHALLNAGLCAMPAVDGAAPGLRATCEELRIPPVLAVGGCVDNTRTLRLLMEVARSAGAAMKDLPFMFVGPEPGNEKALGQGLTFLLHGVSTLVGVPGPVPPRPEPGEPANEVLDFLAGPDGLWKLVGAKAHTERDPARAAAVVRSHLDSKRAALGWPVDAA